MVSFNKMITKQKEIFPLPLIFSQPLSRLDYCNSVFTGLPKKSIRELQVIQKAAARVLTKKKLDHMTPVLRSLHCFLSVKVSISKYYCWFIKLSMVKGQNTFWIFCYVIHYPINQSINQSTSVWNDWPWHPNQWSWKVGWSFWLCVKLVQNLHQRENVLYQPWRSCVLEIWQLLWGS